MLIRTLKHSDKLLLKETMKKLQLLSGIEQHASITFLFSYDYACNLVKKKQESATYRSIVKIGLVANGYERKHFWIARPSLYQELVSPAI